MDLCNINEIKALLARHGFHFSKAKGQNFLTQSWVPQNIVLESGVDETCGVLEVGPGIGPLTQQLCRPQVVRPDRQAVPATPPAALCAATCAVLGSMLVTVPAPHQLPAAGMQARPQRLTCHTRACRAGRTR